MKVNVDYRKFRDVDFSLVDELISPKQAVCLYCCNVCMKDNDNPRLSAYRCKNAKCPLNYTKNNSMKKPHKLTEQQKDKLRKQLEINRSKRYASKSK